MSIVKLLELAQNKDKIKEICKENENTVCPKDIYREGNRIVIEYDNQVIAISIKHKDNYEQWAERRDRKLLKTFGKLRQLRAEYEKQREYVRSLRLQYYRLKYELKQLEEQYKILKIPTLEKLLSEKNIELAKMRNKYRAEQARLRVIKSHIKAIKQKFERSRRIAKMQFESYKPMHSLPTSQWKKRIKEVLSLMNLYFEKGDINGLVITKRLNKADVNVIADWYQFLNDLVYELTEDLLIEYFNYGKEYKKPLIVKMLQNELSSFNFDSVMKLVAMWLKVKP
jgi:hypothetical protein